MKEQNLYFEVIEMKYYPIQNYLKKIPCVMLLCFLKRTAIVIFFCCYHMCGIYINTGILLADVSLWISVFTRL